MKRVVGAVAAVVIALSMTSTQLATAGEINGGGVTISWDDSKTRLPPKFSYYSNCDRIRFTYTNNSGKRLESIALSFTNQYGEQKFSVASDVLPGNSAALSLQFAGRCSTWLGPVQVELSVAETVRTSVVGRGSFVLTQSPPQPPIDTVQLSCNFGGGKKYCRNETVLRFRPDVVRAFSNPWIALFNRKGQVDFQFAEDDAFWEDDKAVQDSVYLRAAKRDLIKGRYVVVSGNGQEPSWRCSRVGRDVVCRWDDGWKSMSGYSFNWNGNRVSKVKKLKKSELRNFVSD